MVYDCFRDHICQFCHSTDLVNWKWIQDSQTQPYCSPKHGTVILISKKELKKNEEVTPRQRRTEATGTSVPLVRFLKYSDN